MKKFIKNKLRESINTPSFELPSNLEPTPNELNMLKDITWRDIIIEPRENDGSPMFYIDVTFKNQELNKFSKSIVFSIQLIKQMYYHPHLFLSNKLQGISIGPKLFKAFIMDFGHLYATKARTLNQNASKMIENLTTDPDFESFSDDKATIIIKKDNPIKNKLIKIINQNY